MFGALQEDFENPTTLVVFPHLSGEGCWILCECIASFSSSVLVSSSQQLSSALSVRPTSTAILRAQSSLPDLNRDHLCPVIAAGPQPRSSVPSVGCRTSTSRKSVRRYARKNVRRYARKKVKKTARKNVRQNVRRYARKNLRKNVTKNVGKNVRRYVRKNVRRYARQNVRNDARRCVRKNVRR